MSISKGTNVYFDPVSGKRGSEDFDYSLNHKGNSERASLENLDFYYREGNMSCDCNRRGFFEDGTFNVDDDDKCGHQIILESMTLEDGRILILNNECQATYKNGRIIVFASKRIE